jgi:hypothetical protein
VTFLAGKLTDVDRAVDDLSVVVRKPLVMQIV